MHNCRKIQKNLHEMALGQLDSDTVQQITLHLAECDECRRIFDAEKLYCENIGAVAAALSAVPENRNLSQSVTEIIHQEKENPPVCIPKRRFPMATAAALVLIMLVAVFAGRMGLMNENGFNTQTADAADSIYHENSENLNTADESKKLYSAVTDEASDDAVNAPLEAFDVFETKQESATAEADGSTGTTKKDLPPTMVSMTSGAASGTLSYEEDMVHSSDNATVQPEDSDPAFEIHKKLAEYNDFINSEALVLLYPQVIMHGDDGEFYYNNFVRNNCGGPLIENTNFYCLHLSFDSLKNALDSCGITDYTVVQPNDSTRTDMVYIYYK